MLYLYSTLAKVLNTCIVGWTLPMIDNEIKVVVLLLLTCGYGQSGSLPPV